MSILEENLNVHSITVMVQKELARPFLQQCRNFPNTARLPLLRLLLRE